MRFRRPGAVVRPALLVASVAVLAGCGGSAPGHTRTATTSTSATTTTAQTADYEIESSALVTMRQFSPESLLWQTVSLSPSGRGVLTTLIGEVSGAIRKPFRLPARQARILRQLVALARTVKPPAQSDPRAELYTLYITGQPSANIEGRAPKRLTSLIHFLAGLMMTYCC